METKNDTTRNKPEKNNRKTQKVRLKLARWLSAQSHSMSLEVFNARPKQCVVAFGVFFTLAQVNTVHAYGALTGAVDDVAEVRDVRQSVTSPGVALKQTHFH